MKKQRGFGVLIAYLVAAGIVVIVDWFFQSWS